MLHHKIIWQFVVTSLILTTISCSVQKRQERYRERLLIEGNNGSGPGELKWAILADGLPYGPSSFAIDNKADVFVVDDLNDRIAKFDRDGKYIGSIMPISPRQINDIAFDTRDNLYIRLSKEIAVYDSNDVLKRMIKFKKGYSVVRIDITVNGTILTQDPDPSQHGHILELDTMGVVISGKLDLLYFIECRGEYFVREWRSGTTTRQSDSIYDKHGRPIFSIRSLNYSEIIGIDSLLNTYIVLHNYEPKTSENYLLKVNTGGKIIAHFNIKNSSGSADVSRTMRVSNSGHVYVLDGGPTRKYQLWEYYPVK